MSGEKQLHGGDNIRNSIGRLDSARYAASWNYGCARFQFVVKSRESDATRPYSRALGARRGGLKYSARCSRCELAHTKARVGELTMSHSLALPSRTPVSTSGRHSGILQASSSEPSMTSGGKAMDEALLAMLWLSSLETSLGKQQSSEFIPPSLSHSAALRGRINKKNRHGTGLFQNFQIVPV